jgi:hypothetical protein
MAAMAMADREESPFTMAEVQEHMAGCEGCRTESWRMGFLVEKLQDFERLDENADLWPGIAPRIVKQSARGWYGWQVFAALGLALVAYKLVEQLPANDPGLLLKLAPIVVAALLFIFLRENPFRINTALITE